MNFEYKLKKFKDGDKNYIRLTFTNPDFYVIINRIDILEEADENGNNISVDFNTEHPLDEVQKEMFDEALHDIVYKWAGA